MRSLSNLPDLKKANVALYGSVRENFVAKALSAEFSGVIDAFTELAERFADGSYINRAKWFNVLLNRLNSIANLEDSTAGELVQISADLQGAKLAKDFTSVIDNIGKVTVY